MNEQIVILDFGSQYTQVIARRIRECNVYSTILHFNTPAAEIAALTPSNATAADNDQALIERILAEHDRAGFLAGWLQARGIGWAADLIPDLSTGEPS